MNRRIKRKEGRRETRKEERNEGRKRDKDEEMEEEKKGDKGRGRIARPRANPQRSGQAPTVTWAPRRPGSGEAARQELGPESLG